MLIDKLTNLSVNVKHGVIGYRSDPYGTTIIRIDQDAHYAELYTDGLGRYRATISVAGAQHQTKEWLENDIDKKHLLAWANKRAREVVGLTFDEAEERYHENYQEDPMGPPSRYI